MYVPQYPYIQVVTFALYVLYMYVHTYITCTSEYEYIHLINYLHISFIDTYLSGLTVNDNKIIIIIIVSLLYYYCYYYYFIIDYYY